MIADDSRRMTDKASPWSLFKLHSKTSSGWLKSRELMSNSSHAKCLSSCHAKYQMPPTGNSLKQSGVTPLSLPSIRTRHDICQDVYTCRLWTNYILPEKRCNVLHFRTKQGKICLRQVHIDQGGQNVKMSAQAIQGASSENSWTRSKLSNQLKTIIIEDYKNNSRWR